MTDTDKGFGSESGQSAENKLAGVGGQWSLTMQRLVIDRGRPGKGFIHLLGATNLLPFLDILPDREKMAAGLQRIMLVPYTEGVFGLCHPAVIEICAWPRDLWIDIPKPIFKEQQWLLEMLEVPCKQSEDDKNAMLCEFTEATATGHQLLGTFLHELGRHKRLMDDPFAKRPKRQVPSYSSPYAKTTAKLIFIQYCDSFGI